MEQTVYLQLEDGTSLCGKHFGAPLKEDVIAEVVFTTAMTGYTETLTDPSYYGQMVVQTFPLIGNYGVNPLDFESSGIHMSAYITREWCKQPSNFRSQMDLDTFLKQQGIPGIYDIDTRYLTKRIREHGVMNGRLTLTAPTSENAKKLSDWRIEDAVEHVTCKAPYEMPAGLPRFHVVLWDFGAKLNILRKLRALNCSLTVVPAHTTCEEILALNPDGIMLSNGPGNPKENLSIVAELSKLCKTGLPIFGICLGHQLLALANGADTEKLKYGHRGANQPVKDLATGRNYITSQNHGYAVKNDSLPSNAELSFININDGTCEGVRYTDFPGFSVQFHPEACGGPHDSEFLFQQFINLMERRAKECR
ncbi:MAG: glutamine-hydrolyzing carbamoyl-phosphate synthase small subunit [Lachnospiraceae bacterium]|nr:glutamine-hydrolyzing carbamoyl-phosphate synthase small subunit [Lachnospiraceae bacterium]